MVTKESLCEEMKIPPEKVCSQQIGAQTYLSLTVEIIIFLNDNPTRLESDSLMQKGIGLSNDLIYTYDMIFKTTDFDSPVEAREMISSRIRSCFDYFGKVFMNTGLSNNLRATFKDMLQPTTSINEQKDLV